MKLRCEVGTSSHIGINVAGGRDMQWEWGGGKFWDNVFTLLFLPIYLSFLFYLSIFGSQVDVVILQKLILISAKKIHKSC